VSNLVGLGEQARSRTDVFQPLDIDQAGEHRARSRFLVERELVDECSTAASAMREEQLHVDEPVDVPASHRAAPSCRCEDRSTRQPHVATCEAVLRCLLIDERRQHREHLARLRRQLIERAAKDLSAQLVGEADVVERGLDVLERLAGVLDAAHGALVLVKQSDGLDDREVLRVVSAHARLVVGERKLVGPRIDDVKRPQQALRVLVDGNDAVALAA
jgi:hypothetical protein